MFTIFVQEIEALKLQPGQTDTTVPVVLWVPRHFALWSRRLWHNIHDWLTQRTWLAITT